MEELFNEYKDRIKIKSVDVLGSPGLEIGILCVMLDDYERISKTRNLVRFWNDMNFKEKLPKVENIEINMVLDGSDDKAYNSRIYSLNCLELILEELTDVEGKIVKKDSKEMVISYKNKAKAA